MIPANDLLNLLNKSQEHGYSLSPYQSGKVVELIEGLQEERKKWGKQVRLWQKLYYPLYGTLRAAQDIVDKPDQFEDWLKRFIDEGVKLMEAAGSGGPDFAALDTGDAELFNLLSEQNRFMNEEMLKQHAEIERLRAEIHLLMHSGKDYMICQKCDEAAATCFRHKGNESLWLCFSCSNKVK